MKRLKFAVLFGIVAAAAPARMWAQQASKDTNRKNASIPADARPPKGMCRIWIDHVPANQQPAPTDCVSAVRNRPNNGRVIFGDDYVDRRGRGKGKDKRPDSRVDALSASWSS